MRRCGPYARLAPELSLVEAFHLGYTFQMESETGNVPPTDTVVNAAAQLHSHDDIRAKAKGRGPSRAFASLMLWGAIVTAAYAGVVLFALSGRTRVEVEAGATGFATVVVLLFPMLIFSSLVSGARERFSVRRKPSVGYWIAYGLVVAVLAALMVVIVASIPYPWWLNLLVPVALFIAMASDPIRQLLSGATTPPEERWVNRPLSRPVRWTTALIGVATGVLAATSTLRWFSILTIVFMLVLIVMLVSIRASWGLPRTGYEWGPVHWGAFGVAMTLLFVLGLLLARTSWVTTSLTVLVGVLVFAVMLGASTLPRRANR